MHGMRPAAGDTLDGWLKEKTSTDSSSARASGDGERLADDAVACRSSGREPSERDFDATAPAARASLSALLRFEASVRDAAAEEPALRVALLSNRQLLRAKRHLGARPSDAEGALRRASAAALLAMKKHGVLVGHRRVEPELNGGAFELRQERRWEDQLAVARLLEDRARRAARRLTGVITAVVEVDVAVVAGLSGVLDAIPAASARRRRDLARLAWHAQITRCRHP